MGNQEKLKLGIIFGGRSGEHEVSLVSAGSVIKAVNRGKFDLIEIGITKRGKWLMGNNCLELFKKEDFSSLIAINPSMDSDKRGFIDENGDFIAVDVVFPVLHGPYGEDGTIQGLFEMMNMPYVGCNVLASSTAMDKLQCKAIWMSSGIPVVPGLGFIRDAWNSNPDSILKEIQDKIGLPCFVKPVNMGSSVGVSKAKTSEELIEALNLAAKYDRKILVEKAVNARELECAVLGNDEPIACAVGEVIVGGEFYDFNDKYLAGVSSTQVPADLDEETIELIKKWSLKAYKALDCSGLSRVDCFLDRENGEIYFNEINTLPGFTSISMYPKMVQYFGISYADLVEKLITLALGRFKDKQKTCISFDSGSDWFKSE